MPATATTTPTTAPTATVSRMRRAKARLLGTAAQEVPVAYQLTCDCGQLLEGTRRTAWHQTACPQCQSVYFVLPVNVYPATDSVSSEVIGGSFAHRLATVFGEFVPTRTHPQRSRKAKRSAANGDAPAASADSAAAAAESAPRLQLPKFTLPKIDFVGIAKRTFTPFRLLVLAMLGIVLGTSAFMIHRRNLEDARQTWRTSLDQVDALLADSDLTALQPVLADAVAAGEILEYHDAEFRRVLNLHQETETFHDLAHGDLLNSLFEAYTDDGRLKSSATEAVQRDTVGHIFVFDSKLTASADNAAWLVDMPVTPGHHGVDIRIALPALSELTSIADSSQFLFAAKVGAMKAPPREGSGVWLFELQPESFVLITSPAHCREFGLAIDNDEALQQRLQQQREFVENSTTWRLRNNSIVTEQQPVTGEGTGD